jgi:hypothetical protein
MELPSGLPNYTGPYISDGKLQQSVLFGKAEPKDALDALSRLHDTAYAYYSDAAHRAAADEIYYESAKELDGKVPAVAAVLVKYGNYVGRQAVKTAEAFASGNPFALPMLVYNNSKELVQRIDGTYLKKEKADVLSLFTQDPNLNGQGKSLAGGLYDPKPTAVASGNQLPLIRTVANSAQQYQFDTPFATPDSVGLHLPFSKEPLNDVLPGVSVPIEIPQSFGRGRRKRRRRWNY